MTGHYCEPGTYTRLSGRDGRPVYPSITPAKLDLRAARLIAGGGKVGRIPPLHTNVPLPLRNDSLVYRQVGRESDDPVASYDVVIGRNREKFRR